MIRDLQEQFKDWLKKTIFYKPIRYVWPVFLKAVGKIFFFLGLFTRGRLCSSYYWREKENIIGYSHPRRFWEQWGKIYIYDATRNKPEEEHSFLINKIRELKPLRILEVGCGFGLNLKMIAGTRIPKEIIGVDFSSSMLEHAKSYLREDPILLVHTDVTQGLPFVTGYFDFVFTHGLLMHIKPPNIDRVFKELVRVTRRYLISMEVVVKSGNHPKYIERDIGRYSYDYPAEYRNLGLEVVLNEEMGGHQVIMGKKKEGLEW